MGSGISSANFVFKRRENRFRPLLREIEYALEIRVPTVVGIGDIHHAKRGNVFHEEAQLVRPAIGTKPEHDGVMATVHRHDQIERLEILARDFSGALPGEIKSTLARCFDHARIGRLTHMIAVRAGGIDEKPVTHAARIRDRAQDSLRRGRAADIPRANEKNLEQPYLPIFDFDIIARASDNRASLGMHMDGNGTIVILTGAGISKESGLDTFRDAGGVWSQVHIEDVATPDAFRRDPRRVHAFYNARRKGLFIPNVQPNAAHRALAALEAQWPGEFLLVTQNVDNLHERAGSRRLLHMHGELSKARCERCGEVFPWEDDLSIDMPCHACMEPGGLRPHVVWFGEMPFEMGRIYETLGRASVFVSIGTSGNVYPAAGFVEEVRVHSGARTIELNLEPSEGATLFAERRYGLASEIVPRFVDELIAASAAS